VIKTSKDFKDVRQKCAVNGNNATSPNMVIHERLHIVACSGCDL
jgi:hypothetical protein